MATSIAEFNNEAGITEFHFIGADGWNDFERISEVLVRAIGARVIDRIEGPDTKAATLEKSGSEFKVKHYDGLGNYMFQLTPGRSDYDLVRSLSNLVAQQLDEPPQRQQTPEGGFICSVTPKRDDPAR
jgi:hypothetical protein